jgi:hypothetical protein
MDEAQDGRTPARILTGGCQCGAVRYALQMAPQNVHYCHCRMCQKAVGNLFAALAPVKKSALRWLAAPPALYASSNVAARGFCAACGTPLTFAYNDSEWIAVTIGSLDDPAAIRPERHYGVEALLPWLAIDDDLPRERTEEAPSPYLRDLVVHQHPDRG